MTASTSDEDIKQQRALCRNIKQSLEDAREALYALFLKKVKAECPIAIGTKVEYAPGKFGRVNRIGFFVPYFDDLDDTAEIYWTVDGQKINANGQPGAYEFKPVGPGTHVVTGTSFRPKTFDEVLGLTRF